VTHEFLDRGEIDAREDEAGREGVAKIVEAAPWNACLS